MISAIGITDCKASFIFSMIVSNRLDLIIYTLILFITYNIILIIHHWVSFSIDVVKMVGEQIVNSVD